MKKNYDIEKVKRKGFWIFRKPQEHYILWLNITSEHGIGSFKVYEGTKHECEKFAKQHKISLKETIKG